MDSVVATTTASFVDVDGNDTQDGKIIRLGEIGVKRCTMGFRISDAEIRPFIFSAIKLTGRSFLRGSSRSYLRQTTISILGTLPNTLAKFLSKSSAALLENVIEMR